MEYNTTRNKLIISQYGRNVQKLVKHCLSIEDREKRSNFAKLIIQIMGQLNPGARETGDFRHKLWDHLYVISEFKLDVDTSYAMPSPDVFTAKPDKIEYSENNIKYKMYGSNVDSIIKEAIKYEDGPEKDALVHAIANHLKKSYLNWNRESVDDDLIFEHLEVLSDGKLKLNKDLYLSSTSDILARNKKKKVVRPTNMKRSSHYKKRRK